MWFEWLPAGITLSSAAQGKKTAQGEKLWGVGCVLIRDICESYTVSTAIWKQLHFFFLVLFSSTKTSLAAPFWCRRVLNIMFSSCINMFSCLMRFKEISSLVCGSETGYFQPNVGKISSCIGGKTRYFWRDVATLSTTSVATKLDVFWWNVRTFSRLVCAQNISYFLSHKPINTAF